MDLKKVDILDIRCKTMQELNKCCEEKSVNRTDAIKYNICSKWALWMCLYMEYGRNYMSVTTTLHSLWILNVLIYLSFSERFNYLTTTKDIQCTCVDVAYFRFKYNVYDFFLVDWVPVKYFIYKKPCKITFFLNFVGQMY